MDPRPGNVQTKKSLDVLIASIVTIHCITIMWITYSRDWPEWLLVYGAANVFIIWVISLGKFQRGQIRRVLVTLLIDAYMIIYSIYSNDLVLVTIPFLAVTVLMALHGSVDVLVVSIISVIVDAVIHLFIIHTFDFSSSDSMVAFGASFLNSLAICGLLLFWVRMRNMNQANMGKFIQDLQVAQKAKDDFLANVSHEIRTPINTISGLSDILLQEENPTELRNDLNRLRMAGKSLMFVVSDILDFSELQSGLVPLEEETYDISSTINDIVNLSVAQKNNKKIELILNYASDLPRGLVGDEKKLRRAIMNIISNAYKFTEEGCIIIEISHRLESYGVNLRISVRDTGIGMRPEEIERLFSSYNQVDTSRSRAEGGVGLGLAICRMLVQQMGGTLNVYSEYDKGTEFVIVVPQKVSDSRPIITLTDVDAPYIGIYFNMEQFIMPALRDEYAKAIANMRSQVPVKTLFCSNLTELKRRQAERGFTHLFISAGEYLEDKEYFDSLAKVLKLVVIIDSERSEIIDNKMIFQIYKPFHLMPIAQAVNSARDEKILAEMARMKKFEAPTARVLVVDDNEMNIRVVSGLLKRYKIYAEQALSGAEGIRKIESQDYDFVFMDHMMPEMDGVECLHRIRAMAGSYYKSVPIIALTANAVAGAREMLLNEGFNDFIEKPLEVSVLERLLLRVLPQGKIIEVEDLESENQVSEAPSKLASTGILASLNRENGIMYCGGEESYEEILQVHAKKGSENYKPLQKAFDAQDWKNYIILIHAVKSSMKTIGFDDLSEKARQLEMAGKEGNISFILDNHAAVLKIYIQLVDELMEKYGVEEAEEIDITNLPVLSDEAFDEIVSKLEFAMFDLDGDEMLSILNPAFGHSYRDMALDPLLDQVTQKIKMSDFMSAVDTFAKIKQ